MKFVITLSSINASTCLPYSFFLYNSDRQERNILESLTYSARFDRGFILDEISCDECYYLNDSCFLRKDPRIISNVENLIH